MDLPFESRGKRRQNGRHTSRSNLDLSDFYAASLSLALIPTFLYLGLSFAVTLPLSLLVGLSSTHLIRLIIRSGQTDVFVPTTLIVAYFLTYFVLRTYFLVSVPFFGRIGRNYYDDYIPTALWCACVGLFCLLAGMQSNVAGRCLRRLPRLTISWPAAVPAWRILITICLGLACLMYLFKLGLTVGNYSNREFQNHPPPGAIVLLQNLTDLAWIVACMFVLLGGKKQNRAAAWPLVLLCVSSIVLRLAISGGKVALIQPALELALVYHYGKRRFRIWEMVGFGVPVLLLAFGVVNFYRFVVVGYHNSPKSLEDVISRVSSASDLLSAKHEAAGNKSALEQMVDRDAGVDALALIIKFTPHPFPYRYGVGWAETPLTFVPRQIWKNKPVNMPSAEFETTYMSEPPDYNGFSSMHMISDFYRNFSYPGIVVGMFLLGALFRFFYLFCAPSRNNAPGLFLYAALFPEFIHSFESDVGMAVVNITRNLVMVIGVAFFLGMRIRRVQPGENKRIAATLEVDHRVSFSPDRRVVSEGYGSALAFPK